MPEVRFRDRQPSDLDGCVEALALVHQVDDYPMNWPADPHRWLTPAGTLHAWIAETDAAGVVGHVALLLVEPPVLSVPSVAAGEPAPRPRAEITRLFVSPAGRRRSVAGTLLRVAGQWATDHGFDLILEVTDDPGSGAIALYERSGWQQTHTSTADWTAPDGGPVRMRHYRLVEPLRDH